MLESVAQITKFTWPFSIALISCVIIQAVVFLQMALRFNKKHKVLSEDEVKLSMQTGGYSVIGPAFSVIVISLSLITLVGPAITFMRVGVIGSASYELTLANTAAEAMGSSLSSPDLTVAMLVVALFGMILGSAPYFLNCFLTMKPMDAALSKPKTNKASFTPLVGFAASIGLIGRSAMNSAMSLGPNLVAIVVASAVTYVLKKYIDKTGKKALNSWLLAIALIVGMISASLYKSLVG